MAVHSYCNSFPLRPDCLVVLMELRDTSKIAAARELVDLQGHVGCKYLKGDPPAFCHSSARQSLASSVSQAKYLYLLVTNMEC